MPFDVTSVLVLSVAIMVAAFVLPRVLRMLRSGDPDASSQDSGGWRWGFMGFRPPTSWGPAPTVRLEPVAAADLIGPYAPAAGETYQEAVSAAVGNRVLHAVAVSGPQGECRRLMTNTVERVPALRAAWRQQDDDWLLDGDAAAEALLPSEVSRLPFDPGLLRGDGEALWLDYVPQPLDSRGDDEPGDVLVRRQVEGPDGTWEEAEPEIDLTAALGAVGPAEEPSVLDPQTIVARVPLLLLVAGALDRGPAPVEPALSAEADGSHDAPAPS